MGIKLLPKNNNSLLTIKKNINLCPFYDSY